MNVLVTGGGGFIGSALVKRLCADGHCVSVVDDGSSGDARPMTGSVAWLKADICAADLGGFFAAARPKAVLHLAARADVSESVRDPARGVAVNVCGTLNVLRASLACGVRRFVFASSGGALYGDSAPLPTPEDCPADPLSPYGASKVAGEAYVRAMSRAGGMPYTILRLANVFGPRQGAPGQPDRAACAEPGVIPAFARAMLRGDPPVIHGDGLNKRDYVHVQDVVEAHRAALGMHGHGVFNIGTGTVRTVRGIFEAVARATRYRGEPVYGEARPGDVRHSCLDARLARQKLGWRPRVRFESGIADTVGSMRPGAAP